MKCSNCKITSSKINCPYCLEIISFTDFCCQYGVNYTCFNPKCMQNFYINLCPCCDKTKIEKGKRINKNFLSCPSKKDSHKIHSSENFYKNINKSSISSSSKLLLYNENVLNSKLNKLNLQHQQLPQHYISDCEKKYDFVICFQCESHLYYYENDFNPNMALKCPQDTCKSLFFSFNCVECSQKILLKTNQLLDEFIFGECPNRSCEYQYKFIFCCSCNNISETHFANRGEYLKCKKNLRKKSSIADSRKKSFNNQNPFCKHCDESSNLDINSFWNSKSNNSIYKNNFLKQENFETPLNSNYKENRGGEHSINLNPFTNAFSSMNNNSCNKETLLNYSDEGGKGIKKFNILKQIKFSDGFIQRKPAFQLDDKPEEFSESGLKKNISKPLLSVYDGNPAAYESNFFFIYFFPHFFLNFSLIQIIFILLNFNNRMLGLQRNEGDFGFICALWP